MAAEPEVQPPPDPQALLAVLEAHRRSESGSRADLTSAALSIARDRQVGDLQVRRAADAYTDAVAGFTRPRASTGYVFAALYAIRRRVALWIGIPFLVLVAAGGATWGITIWNHREKLQLERRHAQHQLKAARTKHEETKAALPQLEAQVRAERHRLPNVKNVDSLLNHLGDKQRSIERQFDRVEYYSGTDERSVRRFRKEAENVTEEVEAFAAVLELARTEVLQGRERFRLRGLLDAAFADAQAVSPTSPLSEPRALHARGIAAVEGGETKSASEFLNALADWTRQEREYAKIPDQLNALLAQAKDLTQDADALSRAAAVHRQGRWAFERSERLQASESLRELRRLVADLSEEYTLVITGGKWRFRNNQPSVRTYYVLVEAVDPSGVRLAKHIRNEEDGTAATVKQWGERVPFAVYERVRKDKQDNGRIDQDVFGRKARGRLEVEVELRTDEGEVLPRTGQITRW